MEEAAAKIRELESKIKTLEGRVPSDDSLEEKRLAAIHAYAWNWFNYHAGQRTSMFNYFLAASALLFAGFGAAVNEPNPTLAIAVAGFGIVTGVAFIMVDTRNQALVNLGREVLKKTEIAMLQANGSPRKIGSVVFDPGIITGDPASGTGIAAQSWDAMRTGKHRFYLRLVECLVVLAFALGIAACLKWKTDIMPPKTEDKSTQELKDSLHAIELRVDELNSTIATRRIATPAAPGATLPSANRVPPDPPPAPTPH